ncbi:MAG: OFA family MFS transporter [Thermodesulfobacteriota bacterium]
MAKGDENRGWTVTFAGTGINLALGILYTWSIFKQAIQKSMEAGAPGGFAWSPAALNDPYAVCCIVFALAMVLAGKVQDRTGPRVTAFIGGILVGLGFIWISQTTAYLAWVLGFGVLSGLGIAFGYASATPPALKWFPPSRTGLIAGLVVSGFGLASVYIAPLSEYLVGSWGLQKAMLFFGLAFLVVVCCLSLLLVNPPPGYSPAAPAQAGGASKPVLGEELGPAGMLKKPTFYSLWVTFFIGAGAGLMVIGSVAGLARKSMGGLAFLAVAILAVGNAAGRIVAGFLSDKIGRKLTLTIMLLFQAVLMFAAIPVTGTDSAVALVLLATLIGFNYGTNLSLFPSFTKDLWGLKNFGLNYGLVFTAWGLGGLVMGRLSQMLKAATGSFDSSFITAGVLLLIGAGLSLTLKKRPRPVEEKLAPLVARAVILNRAERAGKGQDPDKEK